MTKKLICFLLIALSTLFLMSGCQVQKSTDYLQVPEYPLDIETIINLLEEFEIVANVEESEVVPEGEWEYEWSSYSIRPLESRLLYAGIKSGVWDEDRFLTLTFLGFDDEKTMTQEEKEKAIVLTTKLFGGFEDQYSVYNAFLKEFDSEEDSVWSANLDGISCEIKFIEASDALNEIMCVSYYTNKSKFVNSELSIQ
jgi:hypothetical protein